MASRMFRSALAALCGVILFPAAALADTATFGSVPLAGRLMYCLRQLLIQRAVLAVLTFAVGVTLVGGLAYRLVCGENFGDATFRAYALLNNVPGADATDDETPLAKLVSNGLYLVGVATFAVVIGIVSDKISSSVESLRTSNERVQEVQHTVILNWGPFTRPMLRQLEAARREGRLSGPVVVLSERDKEAMDEEVEDELARMRPRGRLSVITRSGNPAELNEMDRVAAGTARRIIMLPPPGGDGAGDAEAGGSGGDGEGGSAGGESASDGSAADDRSAVLRDATGLSLSLQRGVFSQKSRRASVVVSTPEGYHAEFMLDHKPLLPCSPSLR